MNRAIQLLIDGRSLSNSSVGVGVYVDRLIRGLIHYAPDLDFKVILPPQVNAAHFAIPPSRVIKLPKSPEFGNDYLNEIACQIHLTLFLKRHYPEALFHATNAFWSPFRPGRSFITMHDVIPHRFPLYFGRYPVRRFMQRRYEKFAAGAGRVLAVSHCTARDLINLAGISESKIQVMHNWVGEEFEKFNLSTAYSLICTIREKYHLPENYWLYLGGYDYRKNIEFLIRAYASAKQQYHGALPPLVLAGTIPTDLGKPYCDVHGALRETGLTTEDVVMPGLIASEDLPPLYGAASLLIYPSLYEGFGYPPVEAMAVGTPVLVSDTSSLPEVVRRSECRFNPTNEVQLAEKLIEAVENSESFLCSLPSEFTEQVAIQRYVKIIRELSWQTG